MGNALEIDILRVLALDAQGDHQRAQIALERAVMLAEPEGYMRTFLDEGEPMLSLYSQSCIQPVIVPATTSRHCLQQAISVDAIKLHSFSSRKNLTPVHICRCSIH